MAGLVAALFSFIANKLALQSYGPLVVVWAVPLLEEVAKTLPAFLLGAPLLLTHGVFGLVEAFHDHASRPGQSVLPAVLSVAGHLAFGGLTQVVYTATGVLGYGIAAGVAVHGLWNLSIITFLPSGGKQDR